MGGIGHQHDSDQILQVTQVSNTQEVQTPRPCVHSEHIQGHQKWVVLQLSNYLNLIHAYLKFRKSATIWITVGVLFWKMSQGFC